MVFCYVCESYYDATSKTSSSKHDAVCGRRTTPCARSQHHLPPRCVQLWRTYNQSNPKTVPREPEGAAKGDRSKTCGPSNR